MAVFRCIKCGKTLIAEPRPGVRKDCPFCGAETRPTAAPAPAPEAPPAPAPAPARPAAVAVPADEPSDPGLPRRRKRRKKARKAAASGMARGWLVALVLAGVVGTVVLAGVGGVLVALLMKVDFQSVGLIVAGVGALIALAGLGWLYVGAVQEMGVPEMPVGFSGGGMFALARFGVVLPIMLGFLVFYALLYVITQPHAAWKATLVTLLGVLGIAAGICLLCGVFG
jgi:hypothetical protein